MKRNSIFGLALATFICVTYSCKKDKIENFQMDEAIVQEQATDVETVSNSIDAADDDVNNIMSISSLKSRRLNLFPCRATIDSSMIAQKKLVVTFNGDNCSGNNTRSGEIDIELVTGESWEDAGAVMEVTYKNFTITRKNSDKTIIFNGTKTFTNVSGGLVNELGNVGAPLEVIHRISSDNLSVTFPDGTKRTWNIARQRSWSKVNGFLSLEMSGFGSAGGHNNLAVWGINRKGYEFYTEITDPIISSAECNFDPSSGEKIHYVKNRTADVEFGVDVSGNPISSGCADYFKITWEGPKGGTLTKIIQY